MGTFPARPANPPPRAFPPPPDPIPPWPKAGLSGVSSRFSETSIVRWEPARAGTAVAEPSHQSAVQTPMRRKRSMRARKMVLIAAGGLAVSFLVADLAFADDVIWFRARPESCCGAPQPQAGGSA